MSRPVLAPLAVALSALLVVPTLQAEPTAPLFVVEQQRSALVSRLVKQWSDAFAVLPKERRLDHEQLSSALFALRADRLFAVTLAGDAEAVEAVLADAKREMAKPRVATKALGDATVDLTYTPINPCRILDTRATVAGPLAPERRAHFRRLLDELRDAGRDSLGLRDPERRRRAGNERLRGQPDEHRLHQGVAGQRRRAGRVDGQLPGQVSSPSPPARWYLSTVRTAIGSTPRASLQSTSSPTWLAIFKPPGDATSLDIKVGGQRVMRYEYNAAAPNVIGGRSDNQSHVRRGRHCRRWW